MGEGLLSRRDRVIVARHEVPGTKYILPVEAFIKLALIGLKPWAKLFSPSRGNKTCHTSLI
jgi:hypothetical protein